MGVGGGLGCLGLGDGLCVYYQQITILQDYNKEELTTKTMQKLLDINNNKLLLNQATLLKLSHLKSIIPISILGPVLTGKSEFLNQLIGSRQFPTGNTTMSKTKGIDIYIEEEGQGGGGGGGGTARVYMDVQGFDDLADGCEEVERGLVGVGVAVCQVVFWNGVGALDSRVFQRLASLKNFLPDKTQNPTQLILLQRDFYLSLITKDNIPLDNDEYLQHCLQTFKTKQTPTTLSHLFHKIKCYPLTHPTDTPKFTKSIQEIRNHLHHKFLQIVVKNQQRYSSINFIYTLRKCVELVNLGMGLGGLYGDARGMRLEDGRNMLAMYKSVFTERTSKEIKEMLPIPPELLHFKLKTISKQCIESLGNHGKSQQQFICQTIGIDALSQTQNKISKKLSAENTKKTKQFIIHKIQELMQQYQGQNLQAADMGRIQQQMTEDLRNYYSFITEGEVDFVRLGIWRQFVKILDGRNKVNIDRIEEAKRQHQSNLSQAQGQLKKMEKVLSQKQDLIKSLQAEIQSLKSENDRLVNKHFEKQTQITQAEQQMKKYHEMMKNQAEHGQNLLKQIQANLKQNIAYEKKPITLIESEQLSTKEGNQAILSSINKIFELINNRSKDANQEQKRQMEKIVQLERMNKSFRQRIEELLGNSCVDIVERKCQQAENQLKQKEKFIQNLAAQKQAVIQILRTQLRQSKQTVTSLHFELELHKSRANDKCKTSQFMQKLMQTKQNLLQQTRVELLQNLTKYKQQINTIKAEFRQKQLQLSDTVSMFAVKNEQLTARNTELNSKLMAIEAKLKKQSQEKLLQKEMEVAKLSENLVSFETNLMNTTETYIQVTNQMEKLIKEKDEKIFKLNLEFSRVEEKAKGLTLALQNLETKHEEILQKNHKLQIEKEEIECKIKREEILSSNRLKHFEQMNQKLKQQIKQKQNTFELMLLQLRSQSLISNNNTSTNNMLRENSRQRYLKRIDQIEQIAMKELDEISSKGNKRGTSSQRKSYGYVRTAKKAEQQTNDQNQIKSQYGTDKKRPKKQFEMHETTQNKAPVLTLHNSNSMFSMFKTVNKCNL